jgi:microcystin-dependent protein
MTFVAGQVLTAAEMNDLLAATVPTGGVMSYIAATAPTGWLLCDGAAVSRSTYADLFTVISTTYGAGNGSTTFNVPNLKGKVPVGLDSTQTEFDALAETGGAKTHTLTTAQIPGHTHSGTTNTGLTNGTMTIPSAAGASKIADHATGFASSATTTVADNQAGFPGGSHDHAYTTDNGTGGGGSHNNLQPYLVLNFIIKI